MLNLTEISILKSRSGVYQDTSENRRLHRVGMVYSDYKKGDDKPSWDKIEAFYKEGSDEKALWDAWYKYQKTGDPSNMSKFRQILENKFPKVSSWKQTAPNTGKAEISAMDKGGKVIATIDLGGNTVSLFKLQIFMDKCYKA